MADTSSLVAHQIHHASQSTSTAFYRLGDIRERILGFVGGRSGLQMSHAEERFKRNDRNHMSLLRPRTSVGPIADSKGRYLGAMPSWIVSRSPALWGLIVDRLPQDDRIPPEIANGLIIARIGRAALGAMP